MYNIIAENDVIIDMNGGELVHIKDLDVKVITIASESKAFIPDGMGRLYVSSVYSYDYRLSSLNRMPSSKYVVIGSPERILYISMILNSSAGYIQMKNFGQNPKVNLSIIKNIILPNVEISLEGAGAIIDMYEGMLDGELRYIKEDNENFLELKVLRQFLSLIHRYYVEQLYLPDFFESHHMDIVTPWLEICSSQNEQLPRLHNSENYVYLKSLMQAILADEKRIFDVSNKMKVYQLETHRLLCERLNPKYLGPFA